MTQTRASKLLNRTTKTIRRWLDAGALDPYYVDGVRFVSTNSVRRYLDHDGDLPYFLHDRITLLEHGSR